MLYEVITVSVSVDGQCKFLKIQRPSGDAGEKSSHSLLLAVFIDEILKENGLSASDLVV